MDNKVIEFEFEKLSTILVFTPSPSHMLNKIFQYFHSALSQFLAVKMETSNLWQMNINKNIVY